MRCSANTAVSSLHDPGRALPARCPWAFGFREALGSGVLAVLAAPQLTSFTAPLPALRVTHGLCAPTSRQVPTHSAHSWHSRLRRAEPSAAPAGAAGLGGRQEHARVSAKRLVHPWALSRSGGQDGPGWPRGFPRGLEQLSSASRATVELARPAGCHRGQPVIVPSSATAVPVAFLVQCHPSPTSAWV